jgi:isopentenyl-diphosphate delta-isomerase type 1
LSDARLHAAVTAEEVLDVVDADDVVVGAATRGEIHRRGYRHRAVHVLVYDPAGQIYVQRRSWTKDCSPGLWDTSAAGHVDHGETYAAAAERELAEELGVVSAEPLQALFALAAAPATGYEFVRVYRALTRAPVVPDPLEIIDGRWLEPAALERWLAREPDAFTPTFHLIWRQLPPRTTTA